MRYGVPYQGSKNKIAGWVIDNLPEDEILVDLFAGGCAVTHAALLSGKWNRIVANVPVEVLLNGEVIYSTTVNFSAYGVQNIVFGLNVGASLGTQTLVARINWVDHESETRTGK